MSRTEEPPVALAVVLEGVPDRWQMNVLQILALRTCAKVSVAGFGTIEAPAIVLTQDQARHLATQITEILGPERAPIRRSSISRLP
jgi:hypothetical protein